MDKRTFTIGLLSLTAVMLFVANLLVLCAAAWTAVRSSRAAT